MLCPMHQTRPVNDDHGQFFSRVLTKLNSLWVTATYPFASKGHNLSLHYASEISRRRAPGIRLGNRSRSGKTPGSTTEGDRDIKITIEDDCRIAARCTISAKNSISS